MATADSSSSSSSSAWAHIESQVGYDQIASENSYTNVKKAPAWNKALNGAVAVDVGPVMGAISWPALSDSTKPSPKPSSSSSSDTTNPNSTPNQSFPIAPQKSIKRGGGGANGGFTKPLPPTPLNSSGKLGPIVPDSSSPTDLSPKNNNNWTSGPKGIGNDHPPHHHRSFSFRRGNGSYPNNGVRRDKDRTNSHRNFNTRDVHMQQQQQRVFPRGFIRPPPFIGPPPVPPFGNPLGFPDMTSPVYYVPAPPHESIRGLSFVHAPPPPMFFPGPDPQLRSVLVKQIDYYFSAQNLCKDIYLRQNMDEQGWVPVSLIANFNRVKQLTNNIQFILDAVRVSTFVEVQGDKIRKRGDWMNWLLSPSNQSASMPVPQSPGAPTYDMLANRIQNVGLEEGKASTTYDVMGPTDLQTGALQYIII